MTSTIKVNKIEKESGSTLTIGGPGTAVTLAPGASQTGFGTPSSSVLWCTTAKTSPFTAADKVGYFLNTTGGVITVTLPASPTAGDIVAIQDLNRKFGTNKVTLCRNSSKIKGECSNVDLDKDGQATTIVYSGATQGWVAVGDANVTCGSALSRDYNVQYLVIAGGGAGAPGKNAGIGTGAGGAGGYRTVASKTFTVNGGTAYSITVGGGAAGGSGCNAPGASGSNSVFSTITSAVEEEQVQVDPFQEQRLVVLVAQEEGVVLVVQVLLMVRQEEQEIHLQLVHHKVIMVVPEQQEEVHLME